MMHMRERVGYLPTVPMLCCSYSRPEVLLCVFAACYSYSSSYYLLMASLFVQVPMVEDMMSLIWRSWILMLKACCWYDWYPVGLAATRFPTGCPVATSPS